MLFTGKDDEIFDMGGVGDEVEGFDGGDFILIEEKGNVTSLSSGVARKIDDFLRGNFEEFVDEAFVAAGARWI